MKNVLSIALVAALAACSGRTPADAQLPDGMGGIRVQLHAQTTGGTNMGEIIIQNVFDPSQTVLTNCIAKPETLNGLAFCDEMNVLPPGVYEIKFESQTGCQMTQDHYKVVVTAGQTTEVQIDLVCNGGNAAGGLDVIVTENHYPQIDNITFNFQNGLPGNKFICQYAANPTVVTFTVEDAETPCAGLTAQYSVGGVIVPLPTPPVLDGTTTGTEVTLPDGTTACQFYETIDQFAPIGNYDLDIALSDGTLVTKFSYPVHIIDCGILTSRPFVVECTPDLTCQLVPSSTGASATWSDSQLTLIKTDPLAAAGVTIFGAEGQPLSSLSFDVSGYCSLGSPRFNVYFDGTPVYSFFGCGHGTQVGSTVSFVPADAFNSDGTTGLPAGAGNISGMEIVMDEVGTSILSNIMVNGVPVAH